MHAHDLRRGTCDAPYLRDRLGVRDEMCVHPGARPVVERGEVGDRGADRDLQTSRTPQAPEHLRHVRVGGDDHVGADRVDQTQQSRCALLCQQRLGGPSRGSPAGEQPEPDVPDEEEPEEEDLGRIGTQGLDQTAHGRKRVLGDDLRLGPFEAELRSQRLRRQVVPCSDARGEDQDSRHPAQLRGGEPTEPGSRGEPARLARVPKARSHQGALTPNPRCSSSKWWRMCSWWSRRPARLRGR